ncbi:MAG: hypothetical protein WCV93_05290 [Candidatus Shapirobacteria bacterium]|jgi:hypothetical protein
MKKKKNISDETLELIKQQKIKPISRWEFVIRNWVLVFGLMGCLVLLVLGFGLSWFGLVDNIIVPYLWLVVVVVFLVLSFSLFEMTKKAYRFQKWQVVMFMVIIGLVLGGGLFRIGWANRIDRGLETNLPYYRHVVPIKIETWSRPEAGYLSGTIIGTNKSYFEIKDFAGKIWTIGGDPLIRGRVQMIVGEEIKLIGKQTGTNSFVVDEVRPWDGMGKNKMKEN